ncbi:OmpA family protein [Burkholderia pyrrocinia]|uniref:OmpA family protein n=1 Tax=Burkholderia pyrrocinia TaxID=60550 RepID=UPI00158D25F3|nr:OmpA family protein [Burkholderia pyrrocinia]
MTYPDILRTLHSLIAAPLIEQTPSFLGEAKSDVREAVNTLLPNLLAAIVHRGLSSPSEATALMAVFDSPRLDPALPQANLDKFFSGGTVTETHMTTGTALLAELFGDRIHDMERATASLANLKLGSGRALLAMVAPFAFAVLRHAWMTSEEGAGRGSLVRLLHAQRHAVHPALQERFLSALGMPSAATWLESTADPDAALTRPLSATAQTRLDESKRRRRALWLILLLLLAVLLMLAYCSHHTPDTTEKAAASAVPASSSQPASSATATSTVPELDKASESAASSLESVKPQAGTAPPLLDVRFGYASAALPDDFKQVVSEWVAYAKDHPDALFDVTGFADDTGGRALNERLADRRAEAVTAALVAAGVDTSRLSKAASRIVSQATDAAAARHAEVRPKP